MEKYISNQVKKSYKVKQEIYNNKELMSLIKEVCSKTIEVYKNANKTLIAGNGGSAADAQHIAGEFVSKFYFDRPGLASLALTTDTSIITAIGNDYGYEKLFSRQVQANGV
jgi:D-sedoheptulose 7-phosphate isomerase